MIKCANCKDYHNTPTEVKECHLGNTNVVGYTDGDPAAPAKTPYTHQLLSPKQLDFIKRLNNERIVGALARHATPEVVALNDRYREWAEMPEKERPAFPNLNRAETTRVINALLSCPPKPNDVWPMVPAGKYAVKSRDGITHFYEVSKPTEGRWAGFSFLSQLTGAPGDWNRTKVRDQKQQTVMRSIAADVIGAARLFGDKTSTCGRCESPLSNIRSRAAGYGATCANKIGWPYPSKAEAQVMLQERGLTVPNKDEVAILESYAAQATLDEAPGWAGEVAGKVNTSDCSPGQQCKDINQMCSKHSAEYQRKYGRAANE